MSVLRRCLDTFTLLGVVLGACRTIRLTALRDALEGSRRLKGVTIDHRMEACTNQKPCAGLRTYRGAR
jgi:hypothetical protein